MRREVTCATVVAMAFVLTCFACVASAAPTEPVDESQSVLGTGMLSDRYESLKDLSTSLTDEEGVVIATRIGVLASTNRALNNSEVSFSGEVVGDVLNAEEGFKWINLRGSSNAVISGYLTDEQVAFIQHVGDYHATGTTLQVVGTYHIACPEHQGELDVHATSVQVVDSGGPVIHMVSPGRLGLATVLCVLAILLLAAYIWVRWYFGKREES